MSKYRRRLMMNNADKILPDYLCFTALEDAVFTLSIPAGLTVANLSYVEYSTDDGATWTRTDNADEAAVTVTTPMIAAGNKVYWRGSGIRYGSSTSVYSTFSATGNFNAGGCVNSLCYLNKANTDTVNAYMYFRLFYNCTKLISAEEMILPKSAGTYSFGEMFNGCTALTIGPWLAVLRLLSNTCRSMFNKCTHITKIVALFTSRSSTNSVYLWMGNSASTYVPSTCLLVCNLAATDSFIDDNNKRNLTYILYDTENDKYYLSDRVTECDSWGDPILGGGKYLIINDLRPFAERRVA